MPALFKINLTNTTQIFLLRFKHVPTCILCLHICKLHAYPIINPGKVYLRSHKILVCKCCLILEHENVPVSVDTSTTKVNQYQSILVHFVCTSIGWYWYILCVPVSVDTGTFFVYQYRSILECFLCTAVSVNIGTFPCTISVDTVPYRNM